MIFGDTWSLYFLLCVIPCLWVLAPRYRRVALLASCVGFHFHYAGSAGVAPILAVGTVVYLALNRNRAIAIALCVCALAFYKYLPLANEVFSTKWTAPAQPLAISFFVFEFIHLLVDRGKTEKAQRLSVRDFALFTIYFPSLASGPIKRITQFMSELPRLGFPGRERLAQNVMRIFFGLVKKFVIADSIGQVVPTNANLPYWEHSLLLLSFLQGIRIYMDFGGYSDLAIGISGLMNIRLPENFSFPYLAKDLSEFWRRWHISLSDWVRDYIYRYLGGNRRGAMRTAVNLVFAMTLCGLWHGAALRFAVWGILHGLGLVVSHYWRRKGFALPAGLSWAMTFVFVQLTWLPFFYDIPQLLNILPEWDYL